MRDFCIEENDSSEITALIGEILGEAGVNIEGLCLITCEGRTLIHLAVEDAVTARRVLEKSGVKIKEVSEVYILHKAERRVTGKPGSFGDICRTFSDNGIRIKFGYPAENNRFIFGVNDVSKAKVLME